MGLFWMAAGPTRTAPTENAVCDGGQRRDNSIACRRSRRSAADAMPWVGAGGRVMGAP
jgi:hypothetical protein